jgi:hypothetical protein
LETNKFTRKWKREQGRGELALKIKEKHEFFLLRHRGTADIAQ